MFRLGVAFLVQEGGEPVRFPQTAQDFCFPANHGEVARSQRGQPEHLPRRISIEEGSESCRRLFA